MSNEQSNWGPTGNQKAAGNNGGNGGDIHNPGTLLGLLGAPSMIGNQRDLPEVNAVFKAIEENVETLRKGSLTELQSAILPNVTNLTKQISPSLPGFVLHRVSGRQAFVMPVLFANSRLTNQLEDISVNEGNGHRTVSLPYAPSQYINKDLLQNVQNHFKTAFTSEGVQDIVVVNVRVVDLDQMKTEEAQNHDQTMLLRDVIMANWEQGLTVLIAKQAASANVVMPNPFGRKENAYGPNGCAIARVEPVIGADVIDGIPTGANLQIRLQTTNGNNTYNYNQESSKELVTSLVNVTLYGNPISTFQAPMMGQMPMQYNNNGRHPGYFPLIPVMVYDHVQAGEQIGDNLGLASYLTGLYAVLAANGNYMFTEGLRSKSIGTRGNLATTELIIKRVEGQVISRGKEKILTEARLSDVDWVNNWIKENVAPRAAIASDISSFGPNAAIQNFLAGLNSKSPEFVRNTKTVVAVIDAITKGAFTQIIERNKSAQKGWVPGQSILEWSPIMMPVGTYYHEGKLASLTEVDEIKLASLFPEDVTMAIQYQQAVYGTDAQLNDKGRQYKIRMLLNAFFGGRVNINGFSNRHYWSSDFLVALADAMAGLGQLQSTGTMGTFRNDFQAYASAANYVTNAVAGQAGGFTGVGGQVGGNATGIAFGTWAQ